MTLVHGAGVVAISQALRLDGERPRRRRFHLETVPILSAVALLLFLLHTLEIFLFAGFYLAVGAFAGLEEALFFSTTAYATLAQPELGFPVDWRLVGAMEGLIGFLLIGWSTAFFVTDMNRLLRE
ncbi:MAG: two pore domain potassium channel family protein [Allosphingosinicella sp.]